MNFTSVTFWILILFPFCTFSILDRWFPIPNWFRFGFIISLSGIYYFFAENSDPILFLGFVVGNMMGMKWAYGKTKTLISLALLNIFALFIIKAVYPGGAPLGLSFISFQIVGLYVMQCRFRGKQISERNYLFFVTFFPQMVAGPILRWPKIRRFIEGWSNGQRYSVALDAAIIYLSIGISKKLLIADPLFYWIPLYQSASTFSFLDALALPLIYGCFIYFDFSAYSDIAMGIAAMIGLQLPINFYSPYKTSNPAAFWQHWHRTLHKFLKIELRFLYEKFGFPKGIWFVIFVFLFSGYWHGVDLGYIIWAVGHMAWFMFYPHRLLHSVPLALKISINFSVISILWVPFAVGLDGFLLWMSAAQHLLDPGNLWNTLTMDTYFLRSNPIILILALAIAFFAPNSHWIVRAKRWWTLKIIGSLILLLVSLSFVITDEGTVPFVYFQF